MAKNNNAKKAPKVAKKAPKDAKYKAILAMIQRSQAEHK